MWRVAIVTPIRVLLADDHQLFREGLRHICEAVGEFEVVGEAATGTEAVTMARDLNPDVVLMDIQMPEMDGVRATAAITCERPDARVIILTMYRQDTYVFEAIKAGARGYLLKDGSGDDVVAAVRSVAQGGVILPPDMASLVFEEFRRLAGDEQDGVPDERLTPGEMDVLLRIAQGDDNRQIAAALNVTTKTVANRLSEIFSKLHVKNRTQAALTALRKGWAGL
uniref:response regulator transcription factor n=1 Tax=Geotalea uraniireducens TaxID=351604 RepID=UPI00059D224F